MKQYKNLTFADKMLDHVLVNKTQKKEGTDAQEKTSEGFEMEGATTTLPV